VPILGGKSDFMMQYRIEKPRNLTAKVSLPSSKSISNRALLLDTLSGAPMGYIANLSDCDDTTVMMNALFLLDTERRENRIGELVPVIDIKAAGTAMRFLTAYLAATPDVGTRIITGTERMRQRPIGLLVDSLRTLGADIEYVEQPGFPPLRIKGKTLKGGAVSLPGDVSSQYISALMMIAPLLEESAEDRTVYLPEGQWIDFFTRKKYDGRQRIRAGGNRKKQPGNQYDNQDQATVLHFSFLPKFFAYSNMSSVL
jgi:5-enolpyruvylshikimate-3-phosphate synthase